MSQQPTLTPEATHSNNMNSPSTSPKKGKSESPRALSTRSPSPSPHKSLKESDILSLQKELQDKEHELRTSYQVALELTEHNTELQSELEEKTLTIQQLDASITDYETKVCSL